jgi:hypothetical protein
MVDFYSDFPLLLSKINNFVFEADAGKENCKG